LRQRRGERGYILLDALIALSIVAVGFGAALGGISFAGRMAVGQQERVIRIIEERNAHAMAPAVFVREE